jgi:hypothetical protein
MIKGLLNKYSRAIGESEWEIRRIFESRINQEVVTINYSAAEKVMKGCREIN